MVVLTVPVVAKKVKKYAKVLSRDALLAKNPFAMNRLQKGFFTQWVLEWRLERANGQWAR